MASIEISGLRIDFPSMTMMDGEEKYRLRRGEGGKWERRAVTRGAINAVVSRRMNSLSEAQNLATVAEAKAMLAELSKGDRNAVIPPRELAKAMNSLPPGSAGRGLIREILENSVQDAARKGAQAQENVDSLPRLHDEREILQAIKEWLTDNDGFEPVPVFDAPIETAYQRYIHQG